MVSTAAQGGGTPSYYLDSVSGGACRILYFYLGGLKEGMKKRILALLLTLCMALTLLPGMALAAEGENPQPVVVRTAEELRAAMETESIVSLANNIDLDRKSVV